MQFHFLADENVAAVKAYPVAAEIYDHVTDEWVATSHTCQKIC